MIRRDTEEQETIARLHQDTPLTRKKRWFVEQFNRYQKEVQAYANRLVGNQEDAGDLVAEAWPKAWIKLDYYDPRLPFLPWIKGIVHNEARMYFRRSSAEKATVLRLDQYETWQVEDILQREEIAIRGGSSNLADPHLLAVVEKQHLQDLLNKGRASVKNQRPWTALEHSIGGASIKEIATIMEAPQGTVKSWLHEGRQSLLVIVRQHDQPTWRVLRQHDPQAIQAWCQRYIDQCCDAIRPKDRHDIVNTVLHARTLPAATLRQLSLHPRYGADPAALEREYAQGISRFTANLQQGLLRFWDAGTPTLLETALRAYPNGSAITDEID